VSLREHIKVPDFDYMGGELTMKLHGNSKFSLLALYGHELLSSHCSTTSSETPHREDTPNIGELYSTVEQQQHDNTQRVERRSTMDKEKQVNDGERNMKRKTTSKQPPNSAKRIREGLVYGGGGMPMTRIERVTLRLINYCDYFNVEEFVREKTVRVRRELGASASQCDIERGVDAERLRSFHHIEHNEFLFWSFVLQREDCTLLSLKDVEACLAERCWSENVRTAQQVLHKKTFDTVLHSLRAKKIQLAGHKFRKEIEDKVFLRPYLSEV